MMILSNSRNKVALILFTLTMMYPFSINGIEARYIILFFWLLYILGVYRNILIPQKVVVFPIAISLLMIYTFILSDIYGDLNTFWILRLLRCEITFLTITMFLCSSSYKSEDILSAIIIALVIHAICIILGIIFPNFKNIILPISHYHSVFYSLRSTGLVSGYDNAGYLCNIGLFFVYFTRIKRSIMCNVFLFTLFSFATAFTSRVNILFLFVSLVFILLRERKNMNGIKGLIGKLVGALGVLFGGMVAFIYWILTTNVNIELRNSLLSSFPALNNVYIQLTASYADYGKHTEVIGRHLNLGDVSFWEIIFGCGENATFTDIGYFKDIYAVGLLGTLFLVVLYITSLVNVKKTALPLSHEWLYYSYLIAVLLMFAMEMKMSFIFATTTFEILSMIYIISVKNEKVWRSFSV